ncbi:MAG TPA: regulatory protein RecX, partial [Corynebacterium sp.]|nr:regulatory protein RecX [Corynebacterium sp.]
MAEYTPGSLFDHEAEEAKAAVRRRALLLLDARARSRHELRGRLVDLEFDPVVIDDVLDDLAGVGLLNDAVFAHEWVRQ